MVSLDGALALASGVPVALLGLGLLALPRRRSEQRFFGAFLLLWGVQVVTANLGRAVDEASVHRVAYLLSFAFLPPAYLFFAHVSALNLRTPRRGWLTGGFALLALAATAVLVVAPSSVVAAVEPASGPIASTTLGGLAVPLFVAPFFGVFYLALVVLYRLYRRSPAGSLRARVRGTLLALGLFTSYLAVRNALFFLGSGADQQAAGPLGALPLVAVYGLGTLLVAGIALHLLARPPPPEERDLPLAAAFAVPAAVALLEQVTGLGVDTVGLWRLVAAGALAYTVAKYQLFDLDLKVKRLAGPSLAALLLGFGAVAAVAFAASGAGLEAAVPPLLIGLAGAGLTYGSRERLGEVLFPEATGAADYLYQRKLEVYRAGLERALAESGEPDPRSLAALRKSLGLSDREHQVMEFMVRQSLGTRAAAPPEAPARAEPGALLLGRYRVERLLGEGAHGRAYLAHDEKLARQVVVKAVGLSLLGGKAAQLLLREARLVGSLKHPNVVAVHDLAEGAHEALIVMEFAEGGSLFQLLQRRGRLGLPEAAALLDQVLAGLEAAHAKGIVHRDVKPENLLLLRDGTVKVADFGVARETRAGATGLTLGDAVGTLLYMSPEQVRGTGVDARSDLYAAAVVFHVALTGRFYLRLAGKDDFQVRQAILRHPPVLDQGQPAWVAEFLRKALAKDPAKRFASAADMRAALRRHATLGPPGAKA